MSQMGIQLCGTYSEWWSFFCGPGEWVSYPIRGVTNRGNWPMDLDQITRGDGLMAQLLGNSNNYICCYT